VVGSESVQVSLENVGRICVPPECAEKADIRDEAVLVGVLDAFEICSPARYEKVKAADAVMAAEAFRMME